MAKIARKLTKAEWDKQSDVIRQLYTERDGEYLLDADDADELQNALRKTTSELAEAKRRLAAAGDVDAAEYQRLKEAEAQAKREQEIARGNFEKLTAQDREAHAAELKKRDDKTASLRAQLEESIVDGELTRVIAAKYPAAKVGPLLLGAKQKVKPMEIGGRLRAVVLDEKGEPRLKANAKTTDDYMVPADLIDEMRNDKEWAPLFPASSVTSPSRTIRHDPATRGQRETADQLAQNIRDGQTRVS